MPTLRIEHPVPDYDAWKRAFDADPIGRERSGVRRHSVLRAVDDPGYVMVDLEFDTVAEAAAVQAALRTLWGRVDVMREPRSRIVDTVESREYPGARTSS
jgi:hypothetical protein